MALRWIRSNLDNVANCSCPMDIICRYLVLNPIILGYLQGSEIFCQVDLAIIPSGIMLVQWSWQLPHSISNKLRLSTYMGWLHVLLTVCSFNNCHLLHHVFAVDEWAGDCLRSSTIRHSQGYVLDFRIIMVFYWFYLFPLMIP